MTMVVVVVLTKFLSSVADDVIQRPSDGSDPTFSGNLTFLAHTYISSFVLTYDPLPFPSFNCTALNYHIVSVPKLYRKLQCHATPCHASISLLSALTVLN